ncbi:MAG: SsrA-binding protein SmpB [Oscillospiraceae bacterium]|nr:SsrA-binding protein SmpB [Oscillospiraceae bacterium]
MPEKTGIKIISNNKKAYHDYFVEEKYETGIELCGTEVKSVRAGNVNLKDSYCEVTGGQIFALNIHINPYDAGSFSNEDPRRKRRLLMHKREILKLMSLSQKDGYTLVPLAVYLKGSLVKMEIGLCKGKKLYDKREASAEIDRERETQRFEKNGGRGE